MFIACFTTPGTFFFFAFASGEDAVHIAGLKHSISPIDNVANYPSTPLFLSRTHYTHTLYTHSGSTTESHLKCV